MRVIAGRLRGRRLLGPKGLQLRPTSDRLKQTLFDILGARIRDAVFLDVFAGTGAVGIEALSRGARQVVFVESNPEACDLIRRNLELCSVTAGWRMVNQEIFAALRSLGREGFHTDFAFLDPPYDWGPYADLLDLLFRRELLGRDSLAVVEHFHKAAMPPSRQGYALARRVRQGDHCLSFFISDSGLRSAD